MRGVVNARRPIKAESARDGALLCWPCRRPMLMRRPFRLKSAEIVLFMIFIVEWLLNGMPPPKV